MKLSLDAICLLAGYLVGSLPTGYLLGRARGIDIRKAGSGNIGATNAGRLLGKPLGALVLVVDGLKGYIAAAFLAGWIAPLFPPAPGPGGANDVWPALLAGLGSILGHNFTPWLRFKGGKGIATSAGVGFALSPLVMLACLGVWVVLLFTCRYVSLASIVAALSLPFLAWGIDPRPQLTVVMAIIGLLAVYRHRANIQRLLKGREPRAFSKHPPLQAPPS